MAVATELLTVRLPVHAVNRLRSVAVRRNGHFHPLPRNQEEDAGLLAIRHPDKYWTDLIISKVGCSFVACSLVVKR
jgi:hypothetical protein